MLTVRNLNVGLAMKWDVFISHASEDKSEIAGPLAEALKEAGISVWYDDFELMLGDRLRRSIETGLRESRFGVIILSYNFFAKEWPQSELDGLASQENRDTKKILPILHNITIDEIKQYSPMLADRVAVSTSKGICFVVNKIREVVELQKAVSERPIHQKKTIGSTKHPTNLNQFDAEFDQYKNIETLANFLNQITKIDQQAARNIIHHIDINVLAKETEHLDLGTIGKFIATLNRLDVNFARELLHRVDIVKLVKNFN